MRCFISIEIPKDIKEKIKEIQRRLPDFKGKITEEENLHLTLKFLGEIDENKIEEIKKRLKKIKFGEFETEINFIGIFDNRKSKYDQKIIIWLNMTNCEKLQKEIDERLSGIFKKEKRFMSHLTIARVKNVENKRKFIDELKKIKIPKMRFPVENFYLKKSILTEEKPVYETIEEFNLESN